MRLTSIGFARPARVKALNQDRVLVGDTVLEDGISGTYDGEAARAFVADGVGGNPAGELAAEFVIRGVASRLRPEQLGEEQVSAALAGINVELVRAHAGTPARGAATTLCGVLLGDGRLRTVTVGDSEIWVSREGRLFQVNEPQVVAAVPGAPLASYLGGSGAQLAVSFDTTLDALRDGDIFVVCSDGLLKALTTAQVRASLAAAGSLAHRAQHLLGQVDASSIPDDVSCALVEVVET